MLGAPDPHLLFMVLCNGRPPTILGLGGLDQGVDLRAQLAVGPIGGDQLTSTYFLLSLKRAYPVQRVPALCGVWGKVSVASLTLTYAMRGNRFTLACAMRGDHDSNPGPSGHRR